MLSKKSKMKLINWWPPMLWTGISLDHVSEDLRRFEVSLKLHWYNKNLIGIHYGGSLYSMCDPWYMFILSANLGSQYIAVDKAASIKYLKPGRGKLTCVFEVSEKKIEAIKNEIESVGKKDYRFICEVRNEEGEVVTEVEKVVYVRKKDFDWDKLKG